MLNENFNPNAKLSELMEMERLSDLIMFQYNEVKVI
jgi:hypothetical protein